VSASVVYQISTWIIPVLLAITLHEASHGFVALWLGDDTAYRQGRVTLNPLKHIDPFGTIMLPALLLLASGGRMAFGAAKPVPVNFARLSNPRRDTVFVAAAGPLSNFAQALIAAILLHVVFVLPHSAAAWVAYNLFNAIWINLILCVFNMLPLPPLDGGRVAVALLPRSLAEPLARAERMGIFILLAALFFLPWIGDQIGLDLNVFWWLVGEPALALRHLIGVMVRLNLG
jgi:Zn-dependent protease